MHPDLRVRQEHVLIPSSLPFALLIRPFERVVRSDGTKIVTAETLSTKQELKRISKTMTSKLIMLSALWALWSFFYSYDQSPVLPLSPQKKGRLTYHTEAHGPPTWELTSLYAPAPSHL